MKINYLSPCTAGLSNLSDFIAVLQYSLDFSQCPGGDPDNNNQILHVIDPGTLQIELCASEVYSEGFLLTKVQCAETGNTTYSSIIANVSDGNSLSCESGDDVSLSLSIHPALPLNCTITSDVLFSENIDPIQLCD
jgi:hypothetical protein